MKLDRTLDQVTIEPVGAEDRALLRSNPSAAADAGRRVRRCSWGVATPSPKRECHPGRKAINLGVWGGAPAPGNSRNTPTGVPYRNIFRALASKGFHPGFRFAAPL